MAKLAAPQKTQELANKIVTALALGGPMRVPELRKAIGFNPKKYSGEAASGIGFAVRHHLIDTAYIDSYKDLTYYVSSNPPEKLNERKLTRPPKSSRTKPNGIHTAPPQTEFTPVILTQAPTAAVQPPAPVAAPPSVIYTPTPSPVKMALASASASHITAGSGSMIVAKRDMKTLLDAVLSCNEHFNPQLEALVLDLINRTA